MTREENIKKNNRRNVARHRAYKPMRAALEAIEDILSQEVGKYRGMPGHPRLTEAWELAKSALEEVREEMEKANA